VAVVFPDPPRNLYQIRQWYGPLQQLARLHPLLVLCGSAESAAVVQSESALPVLTLDVLETARWMRRQPSLRLALYVNLNARDLLFTRTPGVMHVHINHGESDKRTMTSDFLRQFDRLFVAGQASMDRIAAGLRGFDTSRLVPIGRPQLDVPVMPPRELPRTTRPTILYAPTWEGGRPAMRYGSGPTHGEALVRAILSEGRHRLLYRPHPRTGSRLETYAQADARIRELIAAASQRDPAAGHWVDDSPRFGWQPGVADVAVCDISSVGYDWIASGKPLVVTLPADARAHIQADGIVGQVPLLRAGEAGEVFDRLREAATVESRAKLAALAEYHFGDTRPGECMRRFLAACDAALREAGAGRRSESGGR
jgi:CDP-glycerol glycerophosphotransferase (TagB/SpsB family)